MPAAMPSLWSKTSSNSPKKSFQELSTKEKLPMVVNWAIGYEPEPCDAARKSPDYACKANTTCANRPNQSGYIC
ncbi:putative wall-associated receptor kinase-like 16 [Prunus yedoensis var. nudiflora]|uniref:Putative wall-associated receptor kinase-like 16 n=1 Tax=Prunus yedoensis var. nudiflora TaxID=2094558 RepID=A0A314Y2T1_PRUYE|nr:putative wall-associated receptor kinase-like 16 [Prunus yedoensis var. nudiflora]